MKSRTVLFALAFVAASVACASDDIPTEFSTDTWAFAEHSYHIDFRDGCIIYSEVSDNGSPEPVKITPTVEEWHAFRASLEHIGVWRWHSYYEWPDMAFDGVKWSLRLKYKDSERVSSGGEDRFPEKDASPDQQGRPTVAFREYEDAVEKLLGRRFRISP
ncbi:MAG: hypothetical protein ACREIF_02465 [Chthoniobacterales bacterium]